jgi:Ankyrin repeats (3 copies)
MSYDPSELFEYASVISGYLIPCSRDDGSIDLYAKSYCGDTLVHAAVGKGDCDGVRYLYNAGLDINAKGDFFVTPLFMAARSKNIEMVKLLIELGADPSLPNCLGDLPCKEALKLAGYTQT